MPDIYEWLFEHYAMPKLRDIEQDYENTMSVFAERAELSRMESLGLRDMVLSMCEELGVEAFFIGIRFGQRLSRPHLHARQSGWSIDFLPQLNDPVS